MLGCRASLLFQVCSAALHSWVQGLGFRGLSLGFRDGGSHDNYEGEPIAITDDSGGLKTQNRDVIQRIGSEPKSSV